MMIIFSIAFIAVLILKVCMFKCVWRCYRIIKYMNSVQEVNSSKMLQKVVLPSYEEAISLPPKTPEGNPAPPPYSEVWHAAGSSPSAVRGRAACNPLLGFGGSLWPGWTTQLTSGQSACVPPRWPTFPVGPGRCSPLGQPLRLNDSLSISKIQSNNTWLISISSDICVNNGSFYIQWVRLSNFQLDQFNQEIDKKNSLNLLSVQ